MQPGPPWPWLTLVVRTKLEPAVTAGTIRTTVQATDRDVPLLRLRTMDEVLSASLAEPNVYTLLLGVFAALALVLAAVGLYGVVSFGVTQRVREIEIRMALGAGRGEILRMVLRQGLTLVVAGTSLGLICAVGVGRLLLHLVPSVQPGDPLTLAGVSVLLMGVALAAGFLPARRATQVDPVVALRHE